MISALFKKSRPLNFIFILILLLGLFWTYQFLYFQLTGTASSILSAASKCVLLVLNWLLVDRIYKVQKGKPGNFHLLFFVLLLAIFPEAFNHVLLLFTNLILSVAFWFLQRLESGFFIKKNILNASLTMALAAFFNEWLLLFFIVLFVIILLYARKDFKNLLIPMVALIVFAFLVVSVHVIFNVKLNIQSFTDFHSAKNYEHFLTPKVVIPSAFLATICMVALFNFLVESTTKIMKTEITPALALLYLLCGLALAVLTAGPDSRYFIFSLPALSIITGRFIEGLKRRWVKEMVVLMFFLLPFIWLFY